MSIIQRPAEKLKTIADNEQKVFDAGVKSENDRFWDSYQNYGNRVNYNFAFCQVWDDDNFRPKYNLVVGNAYYMFSQSKITDLVGLLEELGITFDTSKCQQFQYMVNNSTITRVPTIDLSGATAFTDGFRYAPSVADAKLVGGNEIVGWSNSFTNCTNLTNLTVEVVIAGSFSVLQSAKLTHDSLLSILGALKDLSGSGTTLVCTLGTTNLAKLTDEEKAIATGKGWTLA